MNYGAAWSGEKSGARGAPHRPNCCHTPAKSLPHQQRQDTGRTDLTFTMSAGVPTNPPVKPAAKEELRSGASSSPRESEAEGPSSSLTSHCTQQHFLVEGGRPLVALAQAVPHALVDGEASQGIRHLEERENEPLCPTGRPPPRPLRLRAACQLQPSCQTGWAVLCDWSSVLALGDQRPSGHGGTHLPAQRGAEPVVESQKAVGADHTHRHPHHPHLHLLLRLQVDLGHSPAASVHQPSAGAGQKQESAGQRSRDSHPERLSR